MSDPYLGEIRMFGGSFAPAGWAFCDGATLAIKDYDALFTLLGTTYGGDGETTFSLPDLRGRLPLHQGQGRGTSHRVIGELGGSEIVSLTEAQLPAHTHAAIANPGVGKADTPAGNYWSASATTPQFAPGNQANASMSPAAIGASGASKPHDNVQPFLTVSFIIALFGIYPTQG